MKHQLWALEQLIHDMELIDAYLLLRALGYDQEKLEVIGLDTKRTLRSMVSNSYELAKTPLSKVQLHVACDGGPRGTHPYVLWLRNYVLDRLLRATLLKGKEKVAQIMEEVARYAT